MNCEALNGGPQAGHPFAAENEIERRDILGYHVGANDDWSLECYAEITALNNLSKH